jgi:glycosyltransferase involved in cell wall biosynthesis
MRVLIVPFEASAAIVGGNITQRTETMRALRRLGVDVEIASVAEAVRADVDIVHAFHDIRPLLASGRPRALLVVSPIYVPISVLHGPVLHRGGPRHVLEARLRHSARVIRRWRERRIRRAEIHAVLAGWRYADRIVVNSNAEGVLLRRDATRLPEMRVAYSGVAEEAFDGDAAEGRRLLGIGSEPFVLSVARIEPWKNTVSLALALRGLPMRLVIVGTVLPGNEYFLEAVRAALPNVIHVPYIPHEMLRHVHAAAAVHALPSWYETTGLSTLEALAAGRPVVVSGGPCVEEYFEGCARFCNPESIRSIRRAVLDALEGPFGCERERARSFSWDRTARELVDHYSELLNAV